VNAILLSGPERERFDLSACDWRVGDMRARVCASYARRGGDALDTVLRDSLQVPEGAPLEAVRALDHLAGEVAAAVGCGSAPAAGELAANRRPTSAAEASAVDHLISLRLQVSNWRDEGPRCSRYHEDHVALRMVCALSGEGTTWLPESPGRRVGMRLATSAALRSLPADVANALVCAPWEAAQRVGSGDVLFLKGRRWGRGTPAVIHRSPDRCKLGPSGELLPDVRVLLTADLAVRGAEAEAPRQESQDSDALRVITQLQAASANGDGGMTTTETPKFKLTSCRVGLVT
jgi:hypothetical protein